LTPQKLAYAINEGFPPPPPGGLASFALGVRGKTALSAILPLQIYPLRAGTCVLPMRKPWVPAWLPSTCGSHLLGAPTHPFPVVLEEG